MTDTTTERLEELLRDATPGDWEIDDPTGNAWASPGSPLQVRWTNIDADEDGRAHDYGHVICEFDDGPNDDANAALICLARTLAQETLDLRARVAEIEEAGRKLVEAIDHCHPDNSYIGLMFGSELIAFRQALRSPDNG